MMCMGRPPSATKLLCYMFHLPHRAITRQEIVRCLICFTVFEFVLRSLLTYHEKYISRNFYLQNVCLGNQIKILSHQIPLLRCSRGIPP